MLGDPQLPDTPASGESDTSGFRRPLLHLYAHTHTYLQRIIKVFNEWLKQHELNHNIFKLIFHS